MERAGVDDLRRKKSVLIHELEQPYSESGQTRERQKFLDELVGGVLVLGLTVLLDIAVHLVVDGEDVVFLVQTDLAHGSFHVSVLVLEDHHGAVDVLALIDLAVDYEAVQKRKVRDCPEIGGDDDR